MTEHTRTILLDAATITIINVGDVNMKLSEMFNISESALPPHYASSYHQSLPFPTQCIHIALPGASILVDACNYELSFPPDSPYHIPHYQPPPALISQLLEKNIHPEDITHLIITHAHFDHYSGTTIEQNGHYIPSFPNAHYFINRADWEQSDTQQALQDPNSDDSHTLGILHQQGLLTLLDGNLDLLPQMSIIAAPGESPGHQIVRIHSEGQTLYCLGDLYHHPIEVEHPPLMAEWANANANLTSRHALTAAALQENALLIPAHMPIGRIERTTSGIKWITV